MRRRRYLEGTSGAKRARQECPRCMMFARDLPLWNSHHATQGIHNRAKGRSLINVEELLLRRTYYVPVRRVYSGGDLDTNEGVWGFDNLKKRASALGGITSMVTGSQTVRGSGTVKWKDGRYVAQPRNHEKTKTRTEQSGVQRGLLENLSEIRQLDLRGKSLLLDRNLYNGNGKCSYDRIWRGAGTFPLEMCIPGLATHSRIPEKWPG
ncbi:hypothetical protein BDN72DRAFT_857906 [Pluteus cervinus]|uniref:Uncharacterized protein n=1 Tax=Pluteus cervinus TaxID=181527 RepID=A0ACD3AW03_9AGAR|nr:hypothetical protein BDN72DRAFT_857906 [Pluteus cervinus]